MPFKSRNQMRWMYANKPEMAARWAKETPSISKLPVKLKSKPGDMYEKNKKSNSKKKGGVSKKVSKMVKKK